MGSRLPEGPGPDIPEALLQSLTQALFDLSTAIDLIAHTTASKLGINQTDLICLHLLLRTGPTSPGRVASMLGLTTAAISAMATRLEAGGLAFREIDPKDARRVLMHLSPSGKQLASNLFEGFYRATARVASARQEADLRLLVGLASQFRRAIADETTAMGLEPPANPPPI
jgi:DNA-binding MarR family transcriptional regulator